MLISKVPPTSLYSITTPSLTVKSSIPGRIGVLCTEYSVPRPIQLLYVIHVADFMCDSAELIIECVIPSRISEEFPEAREM